MEIISSTSGEILAYCNSIKQAIGYLIEHFSEFRNTTYNSLRTFVRGHNSPQRNYKEIYFNSVIRKEPIKIIPCQAS